jgi:transposase
VPYILPQRNRKQKIELDWHLKRERNLLEWVLARITHYRRLATSYDKMAKNFVGFIWEASVRIVLAQAAQVQSLRPNSTAHTC